jgi:AcrR family transcriptional regulator
VSIDRAPRNTLNRELVLGEAMALVDAEGLAALTIRLLATRLGVKPMALYHHVASKDALLDGLIEQVFTEMALPTPDGNWRDELARRSRSVRAVLIAHPWAIHLLDSRTSTARPATLLHHEAVLSTLHSAGCSTNVAIRAYGLLDSYVYGFVLQEVSMPAVGHPDGLMPGDLNPLMYPRLHAAAAAMSSANATFADGFDDGLEIVLRAIGELVPDC